MAATSWQHIRPLGGDLAAALERLRHDVFASGAFYLADEPALVGAAVGRPSSIDEARLWNGPDGTHSVLDIVDGLSMRTAPGAMSPLPPSVVERYFGQRQPTLFQVLMTDFDAADVCEPDTGRYFFVVTPDEPTLVVFIGLTGS